MARQLQFRRDLAATWTSENPTLAQGEPGFEYDTGNLKIGDGTTAWTSLPYLTTAVLEVLANITPAANKMIYFTAADAAAVADLTAYMRGLLGTADAAALRTAIGLAIGTDVQEQNGILSALAGLTLTRGDVLYQGASALLNLPTGTVGQVLHAGGAGADPYWATLAASSGGIKALTPFTSSGTWNRTTGATKAVLIVTGKGSAGANAGGSQSGGLGGAASKTAIALVDISAITSATVTISTTSGAAASWVGGATTVSASSSTTAGAALTIPGGQGSVGSQTTGGVGGSSFWGGGGGGGQGETGAGTVGQAYGSGGGGGGGAASGSGTSIGGAGGGGLVLVLEF